MKAEDHTEDEYLEHIRSCSDELLDPVAGLNEWARFRRALLRWLDEQDAEHDRLAEDQEHGREGF